ncbi:hypothetical protein [Pseudonocardia sp. DLS-67]
MRRLVPALIGLAAVLAMVFVAATPAEAATYPRSTFRVPYGNTYTTGTVTFYNRTVVVEGEQKAVSSSGCRKTTGITMAGDEQLGQSEWAWTCSGSVKYSFTVPANRAGGATQVWVTLLSTKDVNSGTQEPVGAAICTRGTPTCVD